MLHRLPARHRRRRCRLAARPRPRLEVLEDRCLLSSSGWASTLTVPAPTETLDQAQVLPGALDQQGPVLATGTLGNGPAGAADVQWFQFTLTQPSQVQLQTLDQTLSSPLTGLLSLYNSDAPSPQDPYWYFGDPNNPLSYRLLAQSDAAATGGEATLTANLAAGTYYVALSGSGNAYFHPFVSDSGLPGSTGNYGVLFSATALPASSTPTVLSSNPAQGQALASSPLVLRLDFSQALPPTALDSFMGDPNQTIRLISSPSPAFNDPGATEVGVSAAFSPTLDELQPTPAAPLAPAYYFLLVNPSGQPLGDNSTALSTAEYVLQFHINGVEGIPVSDANAAQGILPADDTPASAHELVFSAGGTAQAAGAIGIDPFYNQFSTDPYPSDQMDVYHFTVSGPGPHAFVAETWAGRIGSPLYAEETLFQEVPGINGQPSTYTLIATNAGTGNPTPATGGPVSMPLANDPVLFAGLQDGSYYLAISNSGGVPDINQPSHTFYSNTLSTGAYILNVRLQQDSVPPQVLAVSPMTAGATLNAPPTFVSIQFSKLMNTQQLQNAELSGSVYLLGSDNTPIPLRFVSYDYATNVAVFLPLLGLPNGPSQLHLVGLTDVAGNPLAGADSSGDYVVPFTVQGPVRGTNFAQPLVWTDHGGNYSPNTAQNLGVLFPLELQQTAVWNPVTKSFVLVGGVTITRNFASQPPSAQDSADYYQFQVLQSTRTYGFNFSATGLPPGVQVTLKDAAGNTYPNPNKLPPLLDPGVYTVGITGLPPSLSGPGPHSYRLVITVAESQENPPPLSLGPAPAVRLQLLAPPQNPAPSPAPPLSLVLPTPPKTISENVAVAAAAPAPAVTASPTLLTDVFFALSTGPLGGVRSDGVVVSILPPVPALALGDFTSVQSAVRPAVLALSTPGSGLDDPTLALAFPASSGQFYGLLQGLLQQLGSWVFPTSIEVPQDPNLSGSTDFQENPPISAPASQDSPNGADFGAAEQLTDIAFPDIESSPK
jgi:hypothetical protein